MQTTTGLGVAVPTLQDGLRVDRAAPGVDLEVEVAADGAGVAGFAHGAHSLAGPDAVAALDRGRASQVGVEVAAALALAVDRQVVAIENRVIAAAQDAAGRDCDQGRAAGGDNVETLVDATAAARRAELTDVAARPVLALDREDVRAELGATVRRRDLGRGRRAERCEKDEGEKKRALQWCSMTRSTMLYSFASSALMK